MGVELQGSVLLRDFRSSDRGDLIALVDDELMYEYMKFRLDEATAVRWLDNFVNESNTFPRTMWSLVIESPDGEFAGWAGLDGRTMRDEAEIGWYLSSRHWGHGYATEAARLLVDFGYGTLGYRRLFATADPDNVASRRVLDKSGLTFGGVMENVQTWRGPRPRVIYELVRDRP